MHNNHVLADGGKEYRLLKRVDICSDLAISAATFYRLVSDGEIPQPIKIGRAARWKSTDIATFVASRIAEAALLEKCDEPSS